MKNFGVSAVVTAWCLAMLVVLPSVGLSAAGNDKAAFMRLIDTSLKGYDVVALGWSKDSAFACIQCLDPGEAGPMIFLKLTIFDAVGDKVLFDQTVSCEPGTNANQIIYSDPAFTTFIAKLQARRITLMDRSAMGLARFPLDYQGRRLTASIRSAVTNQEGNGFSPTMSYSVEVSAGQGAVKKITSGSVEAVDFSVDGYFRSPFESRILVVFTIKTRVIEGDMAFSKQLSGCWLDGGFAAK